MAQTEFVLPENLRPGSVETNVKPMVVSTSVDFRVSASDVNEISDFYPVARGMVSTGIGIARPDAILSPAESDAHTRPFGRTLSAKQPESLTALQEWEGRVVAVDDDNFVALLIDVTAAEVSSHSGSGIEDEEAVIPLSEIDEADRERLREGSIFRWVIGYAHTLGGRRRRISDIVFRDLPAISVHDRALGEEWADRILQSSQD
ncbi:MAG: hypothetical protein OXI16_02990 [Chloroflexota bacterium]|nr:hypothetical protein [Chloroflexota bacterium]